MLPLRIHVLRDSVTAMHSGSHLLSSLKFRPAVSLDLYPEREPDQRDGKAGGMAPVAAYLPAALRLPALGGRRLLDRVRRDNRGLRDLSQEELVSRLPALRRRLRTGGTSLEASAQAFALIREMAGRCLGKRHYDCQILAGWVMLNGMVAEMETGEGKTLAVGLAAATAALAGTPVHVLTVNDYLAERDARTLGPLYQALGLSVGVVTADLGPDERRKAYACDLTYCTARDLAFDYLRDRLVFSSDASDITRRVDRLYGRHSRSAHLLLRGLHFAILDECDSILIDEARTPLVLSRAGQKNSDEDIYRQALQLAEPLQQEADFRVQARARTIELTDQGRIRVAEQAESLGPAWFRAREREALVCSALSALHLFHRNQHYLVREDGVQIIDENTGRLRPGHTWERGLHQMIEAKEGCAISGAHDVLSRISFQKLFCRYLRFAGTTGTAAEVGAELRSVYGLGVVRIPTHRPVQRQYRAECVYANNQEKWSAIVDRVRDIQKTGQPVLVGTRSVEASEELSRRLTAAGLRHQLLSARQDQGEAEIVERAGQRGRVTVATNMAGRGTDIPLGTGIDLLGGLYVIATERHEARRIDRQLFGRCGRQGDPGSCALFTSIEDELISVHCPRWLAGLTGRSLRLAPGTWQKLGRLIGRVAQRRAERHHAQIRRDLLSADKRLEQALGFAGPPE